MHKKNVEIFHQGWLVKSPPNPRGIFRARWRRRWFTLKQGELPGQFFLEYYTDQSCRKRKGIIDLDQVEQVDAGLRLDRQSIKFQHMFDMKTPNRTYYLAADSEKDMRDWVMVICQVCNLQETEEKNGVESSTVQYYNVGPNADFEAKEIPQSDQSAGTESTNLTNTSSNEPSSLSGRFDQLSIVNEYENDNVVTYRQSEYSNRSTVTVGETQNNNQDGQAGLNYTNLPMDRPPPVARPSVPQKATGAIKKIPENLKLRSDDKINNNNAEEISNYRASGPYIPLSDCFSGSPVLFKSENDPKTPLNSLDPKFYDTPRSHITSIGLNLTDDQPNSPKRNNTSNAPIQVPTHNAPKHGKTVPGSVNSSPTDSDGGSTDEEWTQVKLADRKTRPSDSSMENEPIAITAGQCYTRMTGNPIPLPPKRMSLVLEKKQEASDTEENASPVMPIGPNESTSYVDERYDFPRSYNVQSLSNSHMNIRTTGSMGHTHGHGLMTSTPNLINSGASTLDQQQMNFYSNAPPRDNNVFRFDFSGNAPPPEVNRTLKPRKETNGYGKISVHKAPTVDRKLKPGTMSKPQLSIGTNSLKRCGPESLSLSQIDDSAFLDDSMTSNHSFGLSPKTPNASEDRLQYLDIEHTNSPPKGGLGSVASAPFANTMMSLDGSQYGSIKDGPGVAYTTVDFLKTDAFNRVREDSEMTRASKSRMKN